MEKIKDLLLKVQPEIDFSSDVNLVEEGYLDSLDIIKLVTLLESEFGISISGSDIAPENFESVSAIEALIKKY